MKLFLYILLVVSVLFILSLFIKISFIIKFDGNISFSLKILFFKYKLYFPIIYRKESFPKKEEVVYETIPQKKKKKSTKGKEEKIPFPGIKKSVVFFVDTIKDIFGKIIKYFRLEKFVFKAVAAADDAAKTAELYGAFCIAGTAIHQFSTKAKGVKDENVYVEIIPDFNTEIPDVYAEIIFSFRVWRLLHIGGSLLSAFNKYKKIAANASKEKAETKKASDTNELSTQKNAS